MKHWLMLVAIMSLAGCQSQPNSDHHDAFDQLTADIQEHRFHLPIDPSPSMTADEFLAFLESPEMEAADTRPRPVRPRDDHILRSTITEILEDPDQFENGWVLIDGIVRCRLMINAGPYAHMRRRLYASDGSDLYLPLRSSVNGEPDALLLQDRHVEIVARVITLRSQDESVTILSYRPPPESVALGLTDISFVNHGEVASGTSDCGIPSRLSVSAGTDAPWAPYNYNRYGLPPVPVLPNPEDTH